MRDIATYLYEIGQLKRVRRSGWWMIGIDHPESVADHSFRTAVIGYVLASLEGADPMQVTLFCLFHDTHEARITDLHQTAKRYIQLEPGEELARQEQLARLPLPLREHIMTFIQAYEARDSKEAILARDADLLECLIQAREYQSQGYMQAQEWIDSCYQRLATATARQLAESCLQVEPQAWWPR